MPTTRAIKRERAVMRHAAKRDQVRAGAQRRAARAADDLLRAAGFNADGGPIIAPDFTFDVDDLPETVTVDGCDPWWYDEATGDAEPFLLVSYGLDYGRDVEYGTLTLEEVNEARSFIVTYHDFYRRGESPAARRVQR
jgi:hypothetical protein